MKNPSKLYAGIATIALFLTSILALAQDYSYTQPIIKRLPLSAYPGPGYVHDVNSIFIAPKIFPAGVIMLGDSIMTGWSGYIAKMYPNAVIDSRVSRQFSRAIPQWKSLKRQGWTKTVSTVVVELGTNGPVNTHQLGQFLSMVGKRQVYLIVPAVQRPWESEVKEEYQWAARYYPNVHLVHWDRLSQGNPSYFYPGMIHPNWQGIQVMIGNLAKTMKAESE